MRSRILAVLLILFFGLIGFRSVRKPISEQGDGREYVIQTQSLVFDRTRTIALQRRAEYWNQSAFARSFRVTLLAPQEEIGSTLPPQTGAQAGGHFGGLYRDRFGSYRYIHHWLYSAVASPLYAIFHLIDRSGRLEQYSFVTLNLLLWAVAIASCWLIRVRDRAGEYASAAFLAAMMLSPLTPYLSWIHTEIFCAALVISSLAWAHHGGTLGKISPFALALAALQNIPCALFFPLHLLVHLQSPSRIDNHPSRPSRLRRLSRKEWCIYGAASALVVTPILESLLFFETANLFSLTGNASLALISWDRLVTILLSPSIGALWFFPTAWIFLVAILTRENALRTAATLLSVLAVAALSTSTSNIASAQVGAVRYAAWFFAPLYPLTISALFSRNTWFRRRLYLLTSVAWVVIVAWVGADELLRGREARFRMGARLGQEVAAFHTQFQPGEDIEVLAENLRNRELHVPHEFSGTYIWNINEELSLWTISARAFKGLFKITFVPFTKIEPGVRSAVSISYENERISVRPASEEIRRSHVKRHPVFGEYYQFYLPTHIQQLRSSGPVTVR